MSSEVFRMHFKVGSSPLGFSNDRRLKQCICVQPAGFFDYNPALDMPPSTQRVNKSVLADAGKPAAVAKCCAGKL